MLGNLAGFNGFGDTVEDPTNSAWLYVWASSSTMTSTRRC